MNQPNRHPNNNNPQKVEEVDQRIQKVSEKLMLQLTNENHSQEQVKKQFFFMAQNHDKYPFMSAEDYETFKVSAKNAHLYNFMVFSIGGALAAAGYKYAGLFTPSATHPYLRRFRHFGAVALPAFLLPMVVSQVLPSSAQTEILNLSIKYRHTLLDPQFNKKFVDDQAEKYRKQKLRN